MTAAVHAFAPDRAPALRLAKALGLGLRLIDLHRFSDGESLPTVDGEAATAILYAALDDPDPKIMPLLLAADALKRRGAARLVLVAPYLPYLRQDAVFAPGQPLSRDVFGGLVGAAFDRIVTVEPHLHRTSDLQPVFAGKPVSALSAAELMAAAIGPSGSPLIVGPDAESEPWVARVAGALGGDHLVFQKLRRGDREIALSLPCPAAIAGRHVAIVDDICSSGATLEGAIRQLARRGAASIRIVVVHALFDRATSSRLRLAGAASVISTDSCRHTSNAIPLAGLLAGALEEELPS